MSKAAATVSYFSYVLCVWAYAAQIKADELRQQFGGWIQGEYHFAWCYEGRLNATGDVMKATQLLHDLDQRLWLDNVACGWREPRR